MPNMVKSATSRHLRFLGAELDGLLSIQLFLSC